ncbi:2OG-Fe(II) oxygenase family oxidoreductase (macronuclear) [Tetrahymena thermophila SB210]|uniref:2OG-Fe(II) oxygenase family oxidoreductase n=1 Tax=Tetrahymena thermophila (strain SB210) TaxID=312017 RepID=I7LV51_TETTS|nr:2OG-Fe(II) oxygenase family oxidoreductase [Tetrahymena thermophila SB210]EAR97220.1 2OG-Fe(II) oxygenase family oxidoreductase [Tetrahymena thermophila SB210]|eukprot:XP_001017465.1 2OG-Fe(II) oxygenase family oxidoreductase [Tetrahymena thermophila SB210]
MDDQKQKLFDSAQTFDQVQGLRYIDSILTEEEEVFIFKEIYQNEWNTQLKRRTQHYGYKYDYSIKSIDKNMFLGVLPKYAINFCQRLIDDKVIKVMPDQMIINEYLPGQGINPHIDKTDIFGETIFSVSLGSGCIMKLTYGETEIDLYLKRRSILILEDKARYLFKHSIPSRKSDKIDGKTIQRSTRVSLTFRKALVDA